MTMLFPNPYLLAVPAKKHLILILIRFAIEVIRHICVMIGQTELASKLGLK